MQEREQQRQQSQSQSQSQYEQTFSLKNEDHTLGNTLRWMLNKKESVLLAGYSVPHPMERKVNVRVQTLKPTTAQTAMRDALLDCVSVCEHVCDTFDEAIENAK